MLEFLNGKKTYLSAAAMIAYAVGGLFSAKLDANQAAELIMAALAVFGLRHSIAKQQSVFKP